MDLKRLLQVIRRWPGVLLSAVLLTGLVVGLRVRYAEPVYQAHVKLQLTAPPDVDVTLYNSYRSSYLRDEMTVALNNFIEVLQSREVYDRIAQRLELNATDAEYVLEASPLRDSDFLYITVEGRTPELAAAIANAHASEAIVWYGEIRAKPATATKNFISDQLATAKQSLDAAAATFNDFKIQNRIGRLEDEIAAYGELIRRLENERDTRLVEGSKDRTIQALQVALDQLLAERDSAYARGETKVVERYDELLEQKAEQLRKLQKSANPTANVDVIIQQRREELAQLMALEPTYYDLSRQVEQARAEYELLQSKYTEAVLKENTVKTSSNIQIVEMAAPPEEAEAVNVRLILAAALVAGLGIGLLLALVLEYVTTRREVPGRKPGSPRAGADRDTGVVNDAAS